MNEAAVGSERPARPGVLHCLFNYSHPQPSPYQSLSSLRFLPHLSVRSLQRSTATEADPRTAPSLRLQAGSGAGPSETNRSFPDLLKTVPIPVASQPSPELAVKHQRRGNWSALFASRPSTASLNSQTSLFLPEIHRDQRKRLRSEPQRQISASVSV